MDFDHVLRSRRSIRAYGPELLSGPLLRSLIEAAAQAPSAVNEQPWLFSVVRNPALLDRISDAAKRYVLAHPPHGVPFEHLHGGLEDPAFHIFYHAPALVVISSRSRSRWAVENCTLAAENLMLAATAAGLGSCWIGFAQDWLATPDGKEAICVPEDSFPVAPIILGYPAMQPTPPGRHESHIVWIGGSPES